MWLNSTTLGPKNLLYFIYTNLSSLRSITCVFALSLSLEIWYAVYSKPNPILLFFAQKYQQIFIEFYSSLLLLHSE